jgi:hypothetical protein
MIGGVAKKKGTIFFVVDSLKLSFLYSHVIISETDLNPDRHAFIKWLYVNLIFQYDSFRLPLRSLHLVYMGLEYRPGFDGAPGLSGMSDNLSTKLANLRELKLCVPLLWPPQYLNGSVHENLEALSIEDADEDYFPAPTIFESEEDAKNVFDVTLRVKDLAVCFPSLQALSVNRLRPVDWTDAPSDFLRQLTALDVGKQPPYSEMPNLKTAVVDVFPGKITVNGRERDTFDLKPFLNLRQAFFLVNSSFSIFAHEFLKIGGLTQLTWLGVKCTSSDVDLSVVHVGGPQIKCHEDFLADMLSLMPVVEHVSLHDLCRGWFFPKRFMEVMTECASKNERFKSFSVINTKSKGPKDSKEIEEMGTTFGKEMGWLFKKMCNHFIFWRASNEEPEDEVHLFPYAFFRKWGQFQ